VIPLAFVHWDKDVGRPQVAGKKKESKTENKKSKHQKPGHKGIMVQSDAKDTPKTIERFKNWILWLCLELVKAWIFFQSL